MATGLKELVALAIRYSGAAWLVRRLHARKRVSVLFYHAPEAALFERHMRFLSRRYNLISLDRFVDALRGGDWKSLPPRSLVITFDDGLRENAELLPVFERYGVRPTIFLCSQLVGTSRHYWFTVTGSGSREYHASLKRLPEAARLAELESRFGFERTSEHDPGTRQALSRDELDRMSAVVDFQAHTRFHPCLPTCSDESAELEVGGSKAEVEELTGRPCRHFSYPNGDYGEREVALVREAGFRSARTIEPGWNGPDADPYRLKVLGTPDDASVSRLAADLAGYWLLLAFAKRVVRRNVPRSAPVPAPATPVEAA